MTYTVKLFGDVINDHSPEYWVNYVVNLERGRCDGSWLYMDQDLLQYNAVFRYERPETCDGARYLDFTTEEDYLLFVLRWS